MKVCMNATTVKQKENYFSVATNCTEIRIFFLTDYIIRIRAGFDGSSVSEPDLTVILQKNPTVLLQLPGKTEWIRF